MKTILVIVVSLLVVFLAFFSQSPQGQEQVEEVVKATAVPQTLIIPKLNIKAEIEQVGLDEQDKMAVPKDFNNAGWYRLGFKPGENGNAVITAHLDTKDGSPALFYNLSDLEVGDEITVVDEKDNKYQFKVYDSKVYRFNNLPLPDIFGTQGKSRLILITCEGFFDQTTNNYSARRVVYTELEEI